MADSTLPADTRRIVCIACNKPQDVSRRAMSVTCKFCRKSLRLEELTFAKYEARRVIETCAMITVERKANVIAEKVSCGGLVVRGKLKGDVTSRGPVLVGPEAEITGDVTAPTIAIPAGACLEGRFSIGMPAAGELAGMESGVGAAGVIDNRAA